MRLNDNDATQAGKPPYYSKETHFWDFAIYKTPASSQVPTLVREYMALFRPDRPCGNGFVEATPSLMNMPSLRVIRSAVPDGLDQHMRFIVMLREPVSREVSSYLHQHRQRINWDRTNGVTGCWPLDAPTLDEYFGCLLNLDVSNRTMGAFWYGYYARQLQSWTAEFARSQILVLRFEHFTAAPHAFAPVVADFLDFDVSRAAQFQDLPHANAAAPGQQLNLSCSVRDAVATVFAPTNADLYADLSADRADNLAPPSEPAFPPFTRDELPPCNNDHDHRFRALPSPRDFVQPR